MPTQVMVLPTHQVVAIVAGILLAQKRAEGAAPPRAGLDPIDWAVGDANKLVAKAYEVTGGH